MRYYGLCDYTAALTLQSCQSHTFHHHKKKSAIPALKSFGAAFLMAAIILTIWTLAAFYVTAALNQLSISSSNLLLLDLFYFTSKTNTDLQSLISQFLCRSTEVL